MGLGLRAEAKGIENSSSLQGCLQGLYETDRECFIQGVPGMRGQPFFKP